MATGPRAALQEGYKYALLSLPSLNAVIDGGPLVSAEEGYSLSASLPVDDIEERRATLGWYRYENLADAGHYLIVYAPSRQPAVLNHENRVLERRLHRFHLGLLIGCPFIAYHEPVFLEGACLNGRTHVRGHTTYEQVTRIAGGPAPYMRSPQLQHALEIGRATRRLSRTRSAERFGRVLTAFRSALYARALDVRVHQFVRCVEAFVGSWHKTQFAERAAELAVDIEQSDLVQMYEIRSAVEHFSGWKHAIAVRGEPAKQRVLIERAVQAQLIAHSVLNRFVGTSALWEHCQDKNTVDRLWRGVVGADRRALWGEPIDVGRVVRQLDLKQMWRKMRDHH